MKLYKFSGLVAACLLLFLVASIRFSPVVAAYVGQIPALQSLVKLITNDKGLKLALENNFIQPVGASDEHNGVRFTIDGVMADESRILLFYTLENTGGINKGVNLDGISFVKNSNGKRLQNFTVSYSTSDYREEWDKKDGTIDITLQQGATIPDQLNLEVELAVTKSESSERSTGSYGKPHEVREQMPGTWNVAVPIDKSKFQGLKDVYNVNETVEVEDQKITFKTMTVYPTRIGLEVEYDSNNTKKILYFDDIKLVDENGEAFGTISNGQLASHVNDDSIILYFQSNYFMKPEHIYIEASSMRALDKDKLEVKIDLENKKMLTAPDEKLNLYNIGPSPEGTVLNFKLKANNPMDRRRGFGVFYSQFKDASGMQFDSVMSGYTSSDSAEREIRFYVKDQKYENPISLTITDYPTRINGNVRVKVK